MCDRFREAATGKSGERVSVLCNQYGRVHFLLLSDLVDPTAEAGENGSNGLTDFVAKVLTQIVSKRYDDALPTILTANVADPDLTKALWLPVQVRDRLCENAIQLHCDWPSARTGAGKEALELARQRAEALSRRVD